MLRISLIFSNFQKILFYFLNIYSFANSRFILNNNSLINFIIISNFIYFNFYKYLNKIGLRKLKAINSVYKWINQTCGAIKEIKIAKKENKVLENYSNQVNEFENQQKKLKLLVLCLIQSSKSHLLL